MRFPFRLLPTTPKFDFVRVRWLGFAFSILGVALTVFLLFTKGLDLGIDFSGGILFEVRSEQTSDIGKMRVLLNTPEIGSATLQQIGDDRTVMIRIQPKEGVSQAELVEQVKSTLNEGYGSPIEYQRVDYVGPQVGDEMVEGSIIAISLGMLGIMFYLWFRFEWQFGLGGVLAMLHDAILVVGFYLVTGIEFNLTSVAAILTVIGYSINDSVVIYDRIRENMRKYKKKSIEEIINQSVNETLSRTILTGGTLVLAVSTFVVYGGDVLYGFSLAMLVGTIIGTFSSIYVSATILVYIRPRQNEPLAASVKSA
jgi:preprotein translocase SecF subunit